MKDALCAIVRDWACSAIESLGCHLVRQAEEYTWQDDLENFHFSAYYSDDVSESAPFTTNVYLGMTSG